MKQAAASAVLLAIGSSTCVTAFAPPAQRAPQHGNAAVRSTQAAGASRWLSRAATQLQHSTEVETEVRLEDRNVPVAHAGLHDFLYGGEEDHGATAGNVQTGELFDGTRFYSVTQWLKEHSMSKHAAVYSVSGADGKVTFVGVSRNVALSLACHAKNEGPNKVALVKIRSYKFPKRSEMAELKEEWIKQTGGVPEGNQPGSEWAQTIKDAAASMAGDALSAHEESKLKMRKAMADVTLVDESEELSAEDKFRRKNLEMAVEGDDWSGVIDAQTAQTVTKKVTDDDSTVMPAAATAAAPAAMTTPEGLMSPTAAVSECKGLELTPENVDMVLDEVRPYLIADGGNCRVVSVDAETRVISLALQGACGSCPSSTTTMQMGIERVLKENFENLGEVLRVDDASGMALSSVTADIVESILEPIRPAIKAMNGKVEVKSAIDGIVTLAYSGSPKIKYGIELACRDNPLVREVKFVDFE